MRREEDDRLAELAGLSLSEAEAIALSLPARQRIAVTAWACEILRENWQDCGTCRVLLDALRHGEDDGIDLYRLFMAAGGHDHLNRPHFRPV
jgi:hypothetical protein